MLVFFLRLIALASTAAVAAGCVSIGSALPLATNSFAARIKYESQTSSLPVRAVGNHI